MTDNETLLRAYDEQMRGMGNPGRPGLIIERDGPVLRVAGQHFRGGADAAEVNDAAGP